MKITPEALREKSNEILLDIIHNYAAFDISTIDKFNQKLIRTFAYDLKLPLNFEVELDTDAVLSEAVDNLIAKAGTNSELTKVLVDFAIEKTDDDKSWDISYDFNQIAKLLTSENDRQFIAQFKDKSLSDFEQLKQLVHNMIAEIETSIIKKANTVLTLIQECGLEFNDFSGSYLPKHFQKLSNNNSAVNFNSKWQEDIETKALYPKRVSDDIASTITTIQPQLAEAYHDTKALASRNKLLHAISANIIPLSVLNAVNKEVEIIKSEQNLLLISEFNTIINNHIKEQVAPFIYERIGEKFKHYFIDEFQDTSVMQWQNLIPLIDNALSGENSSAMIVGDAKQAIYRWRGGKAEQFLDLTTAVNPFQIEKEQHQLDYNYRSFKAIVDFNNGFFKYLSEHIFNANIHQELYAKSFQENTSENEGYVNLTFLDNTSADKNEAYSEHVLKTIKNALNIGYQQKDICVLVRYKRDGIAISDYLNAHSDVDIMSSETLLISRSPEVNFIIDLLQYITAPYSKDVKIKVLNFLADLNVESNNRHDFFERYLRLDIDQFFNSLEEFNIYFRYSAMVHLSLYEMVEVIIHDFKLVKESDAYVQYFLDVVLDYSQKPQSSTLGFLEHFEKHKEKLSIVSPSDTNAIQIMTIHKSKGLEFPVVILPFANLDIYKEKNYKVWFPLDTETYANFNYALLNFNAEIKNFGDIGSLLYETHRSELELDNTNLLYVALTRAIEQLYIISETTKDSKGNFKENNSNYSGFFMSYLKELGLWNSEQSVYEFGDLTKLSEPTQLVKNSIKLERFISTPKEDLNITIVTKSGFLWDSAQQEAIEKGNLIHLVLSYIKTTSDIDFALNRLLDDGTIDVSQKDDLKLTINSIVHHPKLNAYFSSEYIIYNERDIISENGTTIRPDRLIITPNNDAIIIDYKTGKIKSSHYEQLDDYKNIIGQMNLNVIKSILIYINDSIEIKEM